MKKTALHERREFTNVRELLEWAGMHYGEKIAYSYRLTPRGEVEKVSFRQFRDDVRALATELLSMGCNGKKCAVIGKFSYDWAKMYYALLSIGAVVVPLDRDWLAPDLADTAKKAGASFLFCDEDMADTAEVSAAGLALEAPKEGGENRLRIGRGRPRQVRREPDPLPDRSH